MLQDYAAMQNAIGATDHPIVLSVEGAPPVPIASAGGHGNMRRVGHDIGASWSSMVSLIDIGSGLWSYAHNGAVFCSCSCLM